jgi:hypothetical protein
MSSNIKYPKWLGPHTIKSSILISYDQSSIKSLIV